MKAIFLKVILAATIIYALIGSYFMLSIPIGSGDEQLFISDLHLITKNGWIKSIEKGISLPHSLLVYPISKVLNTHLALRLTSLMFLIVLYVYLYLRNKPSIRFYIYLTFFIGTSKVFFIGTNDAMFIVSLFIFLNEVYRITINKKCKPVLAISSLIISFFTRELILVYLPIIILGFVILIRNKQLKLKQMITPIVVLIICLIINIPSFKLNGKPTYEVKAPPENVTVNWVQRQYLAQILVNEGKLSNYQHPSFMETQEYIEKNGENVLPKSLLESLIFNPELTIKEFFKDLWSIIYFGSRQLSLILLIVTGFFLFNMKKRSLFNPINYVPFSLLALSLIFALLIISYVELRWLVPIFISAIVFYSFLEKTNKINVWISKLNLSAMILLMIYGVIKIIPML